MASPDSDTSPLTRDEIEDFKSWRASLALPAVALLSTPAQAIAASGTRLGGAVWLGEREDWPVDPRSVPLEFLAQVDFADLPPLPDFPAAGILQFFIGRDDLLGADFDEPSRGSARVLWRPLGLDGCSPRPSPPGKTTDLSAFASNDIRTAGVAMGGRAYACLPDPWDWRISRRLEGMQRREGFGEIEKLLYPEQSDRPACHHVGGHPAFTQTDFRSSGHYDAFDRTLLQLTSDETLCWGDVGEAAFLIKRAALLARDFSSVAFYWDCY